MVSFWRSRCKSVLVPADVQILRQSTALIFGLAVLAIATAASQKPGLAPKRLMFPTLILSCDKALADMELDIPVVLKTILADYVLPLNGDHGVAHWARVLENGLRLAEETGANIEVVQLFAVLHDSRRQNEVTDPEHGPRAAEFAVELRGRAFALDDHEFRLLHQACHGHTHQRTHPDVTIQTCWDSDRLDLGRVGITPHPSRLCTEVAKRPETIKWADGRASFGVVPEFVRAEWEIDLERERSW